jgi:hypothetical protein
MLDQRHAAFGQPDLLMARWHGPTCERLGSLMSRAPAAP